MNAPSLKLNRCQLGRESWLNPQPLDVQRRIDVPRYRRTAARNILPPLDCLPGTGAGDFAEQVRHNPGRILLSFAPRSVFLPSLAPLTVVNPQLAILDLRKAVDLSFLTFLGVEV